MGIYHIAILSRVSCYGNQKTKQIFKDEIKKGKDALVAILRITFFMKGKI